MLESYLLVGMLISFPSHWVSFMLLLEDCTSLTGKDFCRLFIVEEVYAARSLRNKSMQLGEHSGLAALVRGLGVLVNLRPVNHAASEQQIPELLHFNLSV